METIALSVCSDCLLMLANGETRPDTDPEEHSASMAAQWPDSEGWDLCAGGECECAPCECGCGKCDPDDNPRTWCDSPIVGDRPDDCDCDNHGFSWSDCDGCGSTLGGDRYAATAIRS